MFLSIFIFFSIAISTGNLELRCGTHSSKTTSRLTSSAQKPFFLNLGHLNTSSSIFFKQSDSLTCVHIRLRWRARRCRQTDGRSREASVQGDRQKILSPR
uniref:Secreted protein n=1 Tax=Phakopsora pachyrhizi TaxID=170000 RepID=A0A0S1MIQ9_PHAPC